MTPFEVSFDRTVSFRGRPGNRPFVLVGDGTRSVARSRKTASLDRERICTDPQLEKAHARCALTVRCMMATAASEKGNQIAHHHLRHQELRHHEEGPRVAR
jgi:hypothetical protein